jgi:TatD DNase family protein
VLLDSHVHLDRFPDPVAEADAAGRAGVRCVTVTESPSEYRRVSHQLGGRDGISVALGVHPLRAGELDDDELAAFDRLVDWCRWVGEVGLDGSPEGAPSLPAQRRALAHVLGHPAVRRRLLTVHSRGAEGEVVAALGQARAAAVLHWFRGTPAQARQAVADGMLFSVNPAMLETAEGQALLEALPVEHVLIETDGPYTSLHGRPARSADVPAIVEVVARGWGMEVAAAREQLARNLEALLGRAA